MSSRSELKERYRAVTQRVGEAAARGGRRASDIVVVAVTKTAGPEQIRQLIEMGHADLGENRVQHLQQRVAMAEEYLSRRRLVAGSQKPGAPPGPGSGAGAHPGAGAPPGAGVRWHMVGHLQRNKVRVVLPLVKLIHSIDSLRLAEEVQAHAARLDGDADVLLQVNISGESAKFGLAAAAAPHMAEQMQTMANVRVRGLMTMAPYAQEPEASRDTFERCAELFEEMRSSGRLGDQFNILSMGMSDDFEVAIECGANVLRIGRALFGEPQTADAG